MHPLRVLWRQPVTALVALLSLAAGIGVNTAVFSLADALFLRPLDVREPGRLVFVSNRAETGLVEGLSFPEYLDVAREIRAFEAVAAFDERGATWRAADHLELLLLSAVTGNYFDVLGVRAASGRTFDAARDRQLPSAPVVLSHSLWVRRFGADPSLVGRAVRLSDRLYIVIGVLPASFTGLQRGAVTDVYIDLDGWTRFYGSRDSLADRGSRHFSVIGRLGPGATDRSASVALEALGVRWQQAFPGTNRQRALLARPADEVSGAAGRPTAALLLAIVGLVLFISCANVATLLVASGEARRREFAVRLAIGAGRWRIVRQLLGEGAILAAVGTAIGLVLAFWLIDMAPALLPPSDILLDYRIALDGRVLSVTVVLGAIAAVSSGLLPALAALRTDVAPALKPSASDARTGRVITLRTGLVVLQIALAVALLNTAGLLLRSFIATSQGRPGFDARKPLLVLQLSMGDEAGGASRWTAVLDDIRTRVSALPGVMHATYVRRIPMAGYGGGATMKVMVPGATDAPGAESRGVRYNQAGPGYLPTLGTRLLRGRFFLGGEHVPTARVVVVSRTLAQQYFPGRDPVGRILRIEDDDHEVIGVVEDARVSRIHEDPEPFFYLPYAAAPSRDVALVVETSGPQDGLTRLVTAAVASTGSQTAVLGVMTMGEHMAAQLYMDWMPALLGSALAALGMALALGGLYAAVAFLTARRTREFGIRMAIGARPGDVLGLVLRQGFGLALAGGAAGLLAAFAASRLLRGFLYGVSENDAVVLASSVLAAALLGVIASAIPAWRAIRIDPARTLRYE